ncbi:MAG TPA: hypothetical protein VNT75_27170 [Symbiobacteriaceae bacterium]|nr:hypothetical protein [Symbiobacteriaceae bacterium]
MVDGPGPVKVYLDRFLARMGDDRGTIDWSPLYEKFWLNHPEID